MIDVARRANVAPSTVSYALSGQRTISPSTRKRILRAIAELGYKPNELARGLASRRSRVVALLLPESQRGIGFTEMEFATGAAQAAKELGHQLVLSVTNSNTAGQVEALNKGGLIAGAILMEVRLDDERIPLLRNAGIPFSMIGRPRDPDGIDCADIDFDQTGRDAVEHLAKLGHRKIAFLNHSASEMSTAYGPSVRAAAALRRAAEEFSVAYLERPCGEDSESGEAAFRELLETAPDLTGIAIMNDRATVGVLSAIERIGASVPRDFSVVSIASSTRVTEMFRPKLTTLEPQAIELGQMGARLLIEALQTPPDLEREPASVLLPCRLVVRDSSGPPPAPPTPAPAPAPTSISNV
jgi:DNA-binding LacI/PurR family transcriptional regulator